MSKHVLAGLLAVAGISLGCSLKYADDFDRKQCRTQADCAQPAAEIGAPLVCISSTCQPPYCVDDGHCPSGSSCVQNRCVGGQPDLAARACKLDADCGPGDRCGFDGLCYEKWGCLDRDRDWPEAPSNLRYRLPVRRIEALEEPDRVGSLGVLGCSVLDPTCAAPVVTQEHVSLSADKLLDVQLEGLPRAGFLGVLRILASASPDAGVPTSPGATTVFPTYLFFTGANPLVADHYVQSQLLLIESSLFRAIASANMVALTSGTAVVALQVQDCGGRTAAGVSLAAVGQANTVFVPIRASSQAVVHGTRTTDEGAAILLNVPGERAVSFVLRDEDTQRVLADDISFAPRNDAINYFYWYPRHSAEQKWMAEARRRGLVQ